MKYLCLALVCLVLPSAAFGANQVIYAPEGFGTNWGNTSLSPLDTGPFAARFQQVYSASLFSTLPPEGGLIEYIVFRVDITGREFFTTLANIQIDLSTIQTAPDGLSAVFSDNVGPDVKTVIGPGPLFLYGSPPVIAGNIVINLQSNPFYYNPAAGNLLLDIKNFAGGVTSPFDAVSVFGDTVSSVVTAVQVPVIPEVGSRTTAGLVTEFSIEPIPEPNSLTLLFCGAAAIGFIARRQTHRTK